MAGHNNDNAGSGSGSGSGAGAGTGSSSGYITNIWQVLFASLIQLLSRIFRPKSGDTSSRQSPSHPPAAPAPATPATPPPHPDASTSDANHQPAIVITNTDTDTDTDAAAAPTTDIDTIAANAAPSQQGQYHNDSGLEKGDPSLDEDMAAAKRRGGQKRAATKIANGSNQAANNIAAAPLQQTKENVVPGKLPAQPAASAPFSKPSSTPTPLISKDDNQANSKQQHQLPRALNDVSSSGKPRDRQPPTKELDNDDSNNISSAPVAPTNTPSTYAREAPKPTSPQAPPLTAVVPTTNQSEIQSSGSHSADGAQNADPSNLPTTQRVPPNNANMDQATTTLEALTVGDKPGSKPHLDKDTAAIAAAAVPLVVTVPGLKQPMIPKPLAPLVTPPSQVLPGLIEPTTEEGKIERAHHLKFMREALAMGQLALNTNETPVGCVLVYRGRTIAKGMNATNVTRNGTRHAEFMALSSLLSHQPDADVKDDSALDESSWGDVDPTDGHIYPYGQKLHPSPKVNRSIISECILYVTVEPCVMCASLLRQLGIKKVYFGAVNDKFGGTGGVFRVHMNSKAVSRPDDRPYQNGYGPVDAEKISRGRAQQDVRDEEDGDGGNVEPGYPAEGGYLRDEAVSLLRRFYVQENGRAPQPRKKEGRAARLYAMENQANGTSSSELSEAMAAPDTPVDTEPTSADQENFPADATVPSKDTGVLTQ
ncbi:CMP/dCMP deaminase- zinc-binding protein [Apiospora saccharicola]|uniref:CMP/dCMP deaminase- zinc-binding protein n=1 Tax=Apiospora saccharicola TaxID=335842 RepID=A0ABR1V9F8_9PEZI